MSRQITILGAGESGIGSALLAKKNGYEPFVSDIGNIPGPQKKILDQESIPYEEGAHSETIILGADEIIKSPGIPDEIGILEEARKKGIPVIGELEFAVRFTDSNLISITGTNGKTTTTLLTHFILEKAGLGVGIAGNIGNSFARLVIDDPYDIYVLEVSSFQLDNMFDFKSNVAVLLNITSDHLDRYQYNLDNYVTSKFRVIQNMGPGDSFIYFADDKIIQEEVRKRKIIADLYPVSLKKKLDRGAYLETGKLIFKLKVDEEPVLRVPVDEISLKGNHNLVNTMASVLIALIYEANTESIIRALRDFKNAPHRLESVDVINGVRFINDSKATNVEAAHYAIESISGSVIWIAGGIDKGNDYDLLKGLVLDKVKVLVCLGKDNSKLTESFQAIVPSVLETQNMKEAVAIAHAASEKGDSVLLSPACASFDLFKHFQDRGDQFKEAVKNLKQNLEHNQMLIL